MSIHVNGRKIEWVENETIEQLLKRVKYTFPLVIVKVNGRVVPRKEFARVTVPDNSSISVIHMTGGG